MAQDELIIAVDLGTSNLKGAVFDLNGREIAYESIEYNLYTPSNAIVENDVNLYWDNILLILKRLSKKLGKKIKNVAAISTSSQGETIVPVDKNMKPLRNAIVWIDTRSIVEANEIASNFDLNEIYTKTGYPEVDPSWPATRILWMKKNEPEIFSNTYKFMLLEDYIVFKLSGRIVGEASVYNSSYYYNIVKFEYINEILDFIGITDKKLPEVVMPGTLIGKISKELSEEIGLKPDTSVVIGALDHVCGAIGAGNISRGIATETTGSAFAMVITTGEPIFNFEYKLPCILHGIPGTYGLLPYSSTGGMVLKWFKDKFCARESEIAKNENKSVFQLLDEMAESVPAGSEGLIMLPFLTGALFPEYNPEAKGVFFDFGINHHKGHFVRAILEALGYMMRNDIEAVQKIGINIEKIISIGGGASSRLWSQIKSDICRLKIQISQYTETALLGSAILAASALGFYKSIEETSRNVLKIREVFVPDKKNEAVYNENFYKYNNLYSQVKKLF
jgi:sugar (pentulose or hexulose) kinase